MKFIAKILAAVFLMATVLPIPLPAFADDIGVFVASDGNCPGTAVLKPGQSRTPYATSTGALCVSGGGGGTTSSNITQFGGSNIATGTGLSGAGIPRVTVSTDSARPGVSVSGLSGNVANATASATMGATASVTNYLDMVVFTYSGSTAGAVVACTVSGLKGGTLTFIVSAPIGVLLGGTPVIMPFPNGGMPASAVNTAIVGSCPALGAGNTNAALYLGGHQY